MASRARERGHFEGEPARYGARLVRIAGRGRAESPDCYQGSVASLFASGHAGGRTGEGKRRSAADRRMPRRPRRVLRQETGAVEFVMNPIVGIGELLWDVYTDGRKVAGGA